MKRNPVLTSRFALSLVALVLFVTPFEGRQAREAGPAEMHRTSESAKKRLAKPAPEFVPGEVVVRFDPAASVQIMNDAAARVKGTKLGELRKLNLQRLKVSGVSVEQAVATLGELPGVMYAEPNYVYRPMIEGAPVRVADLLPIAPGKMDRGQELVYPAATPADPLFWAMWGLHNTGQSILGHSGGQDADIDAPEAWNIQTGSASLIVAVIDTGVNYNHLDLAANTWTNSAEVAANGVDDDGNGFVDDLKGWDFYDGDNDPSDTSPYATSFSHGTHVAGTIGAVANNGIGIVGVMWSGKIMALRFIGPFGGSGFAAAQAILYAVDNGARVLSNSWGGGYPSAALSDAIDYARTRGVLFVAAAGNSWNDEEASYGLYPAAFPHDNILAVAASDNRDAMVLFSTWGGRWVDIAAPGTNVVSLGAAHSAGYYYASGTSMACPHVSGVAGLVWSQFPGLNFAEVKSRILGSADQDVPTRAFENRVLSNGRLNAYRALGGIFGSAIKSDRFGGLHPLGAAALPPGPLPPYFGFDISRDFELQQLSTGLALWELDGFGGVHRANAPTPSSLPPYFGFDVAEDIEVLPGGRGGYVLDAFGGIHPWGSAPAIGSFPYFGFDIARALKLLYTTYRSGSVPFAWVDIASAVNDTGMTSDDRWVRYTLPWDFGFYGTAYSEEVAISSNGYLSLDGHQRGCSYSSTYGGSCSPYWVEGDGLGDSYRRTAGTYDDAYGWYAPNNLVCPFAADLYPRSTSKVYAAVLGMAPNRRFVVSWVDMGHYYHAADTYTFQVILYEADNKIRFQYQTMTNTAGSHAHGAVGLENRTGDSALFLAWPTAEMASLPVGSTALEISWNPSAVVLDGYGGAHFIGGAAPRRFPTGPYWPGWDIARDLVLEPRRERGGYKLDGLGGVHFLGSRVIEPGTTYFGFDVAGNFLGFGQSGFYVYDDFGGVHAGGSASPFSGPNPYFGFDVAGKIKTPR